MMYLCNCVQAISHEDDELVVLLLPFSLVILFQWYCCSPGVHKWQVKAWKQQCAMMAQNMGMIAAFAGHPHPQEPPGLPPPPALSAAAQAHLGFTGPWPALDNPAATRLRGSPSRPAAAGSTQPELVDELPTRPRSQLQNVPRLASPLGSAHGSRPESAKWAERRLSQDSPRIMSVGTAAADSTITSVTPLSPGLNPVSPLSPDPRVRARCSLDTPLEQLEMGDDLMAARGSADLRPMGQGLDEQLQLPVCSSPTVRGRSAAGSRGRSTTATPPPCPPSALSSIISVSAVSMDMSTFPRHLLHGSRSGEQASAGSSFGPGAHLSPPTSPPMPPPQQQQRYPMSGSAAASGLSWQSGMRPTSSTSSTAAWDMPAVPRGGTASGGTASPLAGSRLSVGMPSGVSRQARRMSQPAQDRDTGLGPIPEAAGVGEGGGSVDEGMSGSWQEGVRTPSEGLRSRGSSGGEGADVEALVLEGSQGPGPSSWDSSAVLQPNPAYEDPRDKS